jgi:hypothetical protein
VFAINLLREKVILTFLIRVAATFFATTHYSMLIGKVGRGIILRRDMFSRYRILVSPWNFLLAPTRKCIDIVLLRQEV